MKFLIPTLILSAMLSACGGGISIGNTPPVEPVIAAAAKAEFIALANTASCAQTRNRLFLIDGKQMFWDRVGTCADASYSQTLYGVTPQSILCSTSDSIAGPRTTCTDERYRAMFVQINQNLDKPDLGLGSAHQVTQLDVVPSAAKSLQFVSLRPETHFGIPPANLVIRDEATWNKFLDDSKINSMLRLNYPLGDEDLTLKVDFSKKMVLAVFFAKKNTCDKTEIVRLTANGQKIVAEYIETEVVAPPLCDLIAPGTRTPMNLVVVDRSELDVQFVKINALRVSYSFYLPDSFLQISFPYEQRIIKDITSFDKIVEGSWGSNVRPQAPDFSKRMLVLISGGASNGCGRVSNINAWISNGNLTIAYKQPISKSGLFTCTLSFVGPQFIELDRSDLPIEFIEIPNWY